MLFKFFKLEPLRLKLKTPRSGRSSRCRFHFAELLSFVDAPLAGNKAACTTLAKILLKAYVLNVSDKEKSLGCLRRKEMLSN